MSHSSDKKRKAVIISHQEDLDGIVSSALIQYYLHTKGYDTNSIIVFLVDYNTVLSIFDDYAYELNHSDLYFCDIGLNKRLVNRLMNLSNKSDENKNIIRIYFDHHKINYDASRTMKIVKDKFSVYENSSLSKPDNDLCTAETISKYLNIKSTHLNLLAECAHIIDFKTSEKENENHKFAHDLNRYIVYHQCKIDRLKALSFHMTSSTLWNNYASELIKEKTSIDNWYRMGLKRVNLNRQVFTINKIKLVVSYSYLKAEEITNYLMKENEKCDIFIGFSESNLYANVQTKQEISHLIASLFDGGGHTRRAGFKIPPKVIESIGSDFFRDTFKNIILMKINSFLLNDVL